MMKTSTFWTYLKLEMNTEAKEVVAMLKSRHDDLGYHFGDIETAFIADNNCSDDEDVVIKKLENISVDISVSIIIGYHLLGS